ncbi:MAG: VanZ family protein [Nanoarchaeota archaeon]|nr:VanZ family protein [Nanoarchaeota archaeon]
MVIDKILKGIYNKRFSSALSLLLAIEIFYFSSLPGARGVASIPWLSIAYHFIVFFLFSFFLAFSLNNEKIDNCRTLLLIIAIAIVYAILDEFHQMFVPLRDANINDILTDSAGIFSSVIVYIRIKLNNNHKSGGIVQTP